MIDIGLYTRLVTYAWLYLQISVACLQCDSWLLSSFMLLCSYPSVVCLSCYIFIFWLQFILLLFCAHCLYARALPFTHTHRVAFWRPWICTSRYWTLCFYCAGVRGDGTLPEELELLPIRFRYSYLSNLHIIPDSRYIRFSYYSSSSFI